GRKRESGIHPPQSLGERPCEWRNQGIRRADHGAVLVQREFREANTIMTREMKTPDGRIVRLRPIRLHRLNHTHGAPAAPVASSPLPAAQGSGARPSDLQSIRSGQAYRVSSSPDQSLVTPQLANELSQLLERFAQENGFNAEQPLIVAFGRGTLGLHR